MEYIIKDWAGNDIEDNFKTFDDAWEYIYENFEEEDYEELHVEQY